MWRDDSELTAPAIVISSLGGLVYGKDALTPQDSYRAGVLRHALKAPLGRSRPLHDTAPGPGAKSCTRHDFASEVLCHRVLSKGSAVAHVRSTNNLCSLAAESCNGIRMSSSSNVRAHGDTKVPPRSTMDARASRKRGWKVKGQLAGEWRDRSGRRRRASPAENGNSDAIIVPATSGSAGAAENSVVSSIPGSSSYAGTKVSFEGLVDELRERLPRASLFANYVAERQESNHSMCPRADAVVSGMVNAMDLPEAEEMTSNHGQYDSRGCSVEDARRSAAGTSEVAKLRGNGSLEQRREGAAAVAGLMPPGCLRLRHPVLGTLRAPTNLQPLTKLVPTGNTNANPRLNSSIGCEQSVSVRQPTGSRLFPDDNSFMSVTTGTSAGAVGSNTSPSAEMVAAAKAHERALPLLQVCAVRIVEPAGC